MGGGAALPADSIGTPWSDNYVFSTGNLILDLLHNFFLECGGAHPQAVRLRDGERSSLARGLRVFDGPRRRARACLGACAQVSHHRRHDQDAAGSQRPRRQGPGGAVLHAGGRPLGRIASAPTTTPRSARSGAMASRRFPVIRPGSWRRLTGIPMEARSPNSRASPLPSRPTTSRKRSSKSRTSSTRLSRVEPRTRGGAIG
jgi:hypothetical protein